MNPLDLDRLAMLEAAATPGPWHVARADDIGSMPAIDLVSGETDREERMIAATLVRLPPYLAPSDRRHTENARLIAAMRTALPELLRLAAIGKAAERGE